MKIIEQIGAKEKAISVIASCETANHIRAAEKYINLYYVKYEDLLGKKILDNILRDKISELYNYE